MKSNIILKIVVAVIFLLAVVGFARVAMAGDNTADMTSAAGFVVNLAVVLLVVTTALAVVLSVWSVLKNPKALKNTLLGLGVFAVLFAVAYFSADDLAVFDANKERLIEQGSTSKWSGTGLNLSLILLLIGGAIFVFDMLRSLIKS